MPSSYTYTLNRMVVEELFSLSTRQRDYFKAIFRDLADNPFQRGESIFQDSVGREVQMKTFGQWVISYWPDHAVRELRIIGFQKFHTIK